MSARDVWVVIPAYNEEETLANVLEAFSEENYSLLVIDDGSDDHTSNIALAYPVVLLRHMINLGQGAALKTGFDYLINQTNAKYVVTFDSDGQHNVNEIHQLINPLISQNYDVVLGSRFLTGRNGNNIPLSKLITLKLGVLFTRMTTKLKVTDTHNGLRGFTIEALKRIQISQNGMAHASEIISEIAKKELRWKEVQVTIEYTSYSKKKGQSIFNSVNILWDLFFGRD